MPKYRVLTKSFINDTIVEAGAIVDYDGKAGSNLEALDKPKGKGKAAEPAAEPVLDDGGEAFAEENLV